MLISLILQAVNQINVITGVLVKFSCHFFDKVLSEFYFIFLKMFLIFFIFIIGVLT